IALGACAILCKRWEFYLFLLFATVSTLGRLPVDQSVVRLSSGDYIYQFFVLSDAVSQGKVFMASWLSVLFYNSQLKAQLFLLLILLKDVVLNRSTTAQSMVST